jgi:hypothetical protein
VKHTRGYADPCILRLYLTLLDWARLVKAYVRLMRAMRPR